MKAPPRSSAFTAIELLMVVAVIAVLLALLTPAIYRPHHDSYYSTCLSNQRQMTLAYQMWKGDNDGKYPWQVSTTTNGTMELIADGHVASQFRAMSNYLKSLTVYICPADPGREAATNYENFKNQNTSFFLNVDADVATNSATAILIGDRHLMANGRPVDPGLFHFSDNPDLRWTWELHARSRYRPCGGLGFIDGHSELVISRNLNAVFQRQGLTTGRLVVP